MSSYYGIALLRPPQEDKEAAEEEEDPSSLVFSSRPLALKALKAHPGARFKAFDTMEQAATFVREKLFAEVKPVQKDDEEEHDDAGDDATDSAASSSSSSKPPAAPSEGCPHPSLKAQELKLLKEALTRQDADECRRLVQSNPRFLVTPCDTPAILHSGTRANALHVACNAQSLAMVHLVLDLIHDPALLADMYPAENAEDRAKRQEYLVDLYLNMPNKGHNDTPLHAAAKFGCLDIVRVLAQFSSCDVERKNRRGETPSEAACTRGPAADDVELKKEIEKVLSGQVYIPVIRDGDYFLPGYIGAPWSPRSPRDGGGDNNNKLSASYRQHILDSPRPNLNPRSPLAVASKSPLIVVQNETQSRNQLPAANQSNLTVRALLGPLMPREAEDITQEWNKSAESKNLRLADPQRGLEKQGRRLAKKYDVNLHEYWDFLDAYCDLTSKDGLRLLDNHLYECGRRLEREERERVMQRLDEELSGMDLGEREWREAARGDKNSSSSNNGSGNSPKNSSSSSDCEGNGNVVADSNSNLSGSSNDNSDKSSSSNDVDNFNDSSNDNGGSNNNLRDSNNDIVDSNSSNDGDSNSNERDSSENNNSLDRTDNDAAVSDEVDRAAQLLLSPVSQLVLDFDSLKLATPGKETGSRKVETGSHWFNAEAGRREEPVVPDVTVSPAEDDEDSNGNQLSSSSTAAFREQEASFDSVGSPAKDAENDDEDIYSDCENESVSSYETADGGQNVFLQGPVPTALDRNVYELVQETEIDRKAYANVWLWRELIHAKSLAERAKWGKCVPAAGGKGKHGQPRRLDFGV